MTLIAEFQITEGNIRKTGQNAARKERPVKRAPPYAPELVEKPTRSHGKRCFVARTYVSRRKRLNRHDGLMDTNYLH